MQSEVLRPEGVDDGRPWGCAMSNATAVTATAPPLTPYTDVSDGSHERDERRRHCPAFGASEGKCTGKWGGPAPVLQPGDPVCLIWR